MFFLKMYDGRNAECSNNDDDHFSSFRWVEVVPIKDCMIGGGRANCS